MTEECESIADWLAGKAARARLQAYALVERELLEAGLFVVVLDTKTFDVSPRAELLGHVEARRKQP